MGIGQRRKINIVLPGEQTGTDGVEPSFEFSKQVWAEANEISQSFVSRDAQTFVERIWTFLIDYDSSIPIDFNVIVEIDNYQFKTNIIDRGDRQSSGNKYGYKFIPNNDGMYLRLTGGTESRG